MRAGAVVNIQEVLAAIGFTLCLLLLVHHFLGVRRQALLRTWWMMRSAQLRHRARRWSQKWSHRRQQQRQPAPRHPEPRPRSAGAAGHRGTDAGLPDPDELSRRRARSRGKPGNAGDSADPGNSPEGANGEAAREAAELIERARRHAAGGRQPSGPRGSDNVVRPPRFGNRRDDLH